MKFKDFAQRIGKVMKSDENISTFTRTLFESLFPTDADCEFLSDIGNHTFRAYYYGSVNITKIAKKIYGFVNPRFFEIYLLNLHKNNELYKSFSDVILGITPDNVCEMVANLFYLIQTKILMKVIDLFL